MSTWEQTKKQKKRNNLHIHKKYLLNIHRCFKSTKQNKLNYLRVFKKKKHLLHMSLTIKRRRTTGKKTTKSKERNIIAFSFKAIDDTNMTKMKMKLRFEYDVFTKYIYIIYIIYVLAKVYERKSLIRRRRRRRGRRRIKLKILIKWT